MKRLMPTGWVRPTPNSLLQAQPWFLEMRRGGRGDKNQCARALPSDLIAWS